MKSSASIAISLTLIMFILVLAAAVWFLFQGQQTLQGELSTSQENIQELENQQAEMELNEQALQATLDTEQDLHATTSSENVELEGQLSQSANANSTLEAVSEEQAATLEAANATVTTIASRGPAITIIEPQTGQSFEVNQPVSIVVVASDPQGITSMTVFNINSDPITQSFDGSNTQEILRTTWTPSETGAFTITASAINNNEVPSQSSQFNTVTVNVVEPQPTATPTATETPTATDTPEPTEEATPDN